MKKFFPLVLIFVFLSACSNSFNSNKNVSFDEGTVYINLQNKISNENNSRTVAPIGGSSYTEVKEWIITFTRGDFFKDFTFSTDNPDTIGEFSLPVGNGYTVCIEGSVESDPTQVFYGETTFDLSSGSSANVTINVSRKKTSTGTLRYTIILEGDIPDSEEDGQNTFVVSLIDLSNDGLTYSSNSSNLSTNLSALNIEVIYNDGELQIFSGAEGIKSGFYKIVVNYNNNNVDYYLNISDPYIEICDNCISEAEIMGIGFSTSRTYYVKSGESSYNGLSVEYRANFADLFNRLKDEDCWNEINFYFDADDDISSVTKMNFISLLPMGKSINIYSGDRKIIDNNELITTFYVSASDTYTDENNVLHIPFETLYDVSDLIEKIDYSDKDVTIIVNGYINETNGCTFSKVKNITISGATNVTGVLSLPDFESDNMTDVIDYQESPGISGLNIDNRNNSIRNITIKNVQICGGNGFNGSSSSQWGGLRIDFGANTEKVSLEKINITNCRFSNNKGGSVGGSILLIGNGNGKEVAVDVRGCLFENSTSGDAIGGILSIWSEVKSVLVDSCSFSENGCPDIVIPNTTFTSASNVTELTVKNSYFGTNNFNNQDNQTEKGSNIACRTGNLKIGVGNTSVLGSESKIINISFQKGKTINVCEDISAENISYILKPIDYQNDSAVNYTQTEPVVSVAEGVTLTDVINKFQMFDANYILNESNGCIQTPTIARGSGTASDPYLIGSIEDYDYFSAKVAESAGGASNPYTNVSVYYKVTADLDFSTREQWTSKPFDEGAITSGTKGAGGFFGVFDGDGHVFKGMKGDCPLFQLLEEESIVKNLAIEGDFNYTGNRGYTTSFSPFSITTKGYVIGCSFKGTSNSTTTNKYIFGSCTYKAQLIGCLVTLTDDSSIPAYATGSSNPGTAITAYSNSTDKTAEELNTDINTWNAKSTVPEAAKCEWTFAEEGGVFKIVRN